MKSAGRWPALLHTSSGGQVRHRNFANSPSFRPWVGRLPKQEVALFKHRKALLVSTAFLLASASPAFAQNSTDDVVDVTTNDTVDVTTDRGDRDDDDGNWGLLGLLGLAGLLGLKRRDPDYPRDTTAGTTTNRP
ncbi:MAG: WGxxGxxG family protein [Sphingomicrobium sp.]